jgi:hypothetical protein
MWSISKGSLSNSWHIRQYSQRRFARCQTSRVSAASMSVSGGSAFLGLDAECAARLGLKDRQQRPGFGKGEKFFPLGRGQTVVLIPYGEVVHAGFVSLPEIQIE